MVHCFSNKCYRGALGTSIAKMKNSALSRVLNKATGIPGNSLVLFFTYLSLCSEKQEQDPTVNMASTFSQMGPKDRVTLQSVLNVAQRLRATASQNVNWEMGFSLTLVVSPVLCVPQVTVELLILCSSEM